MSKKLGSRGKVNPKAINKDTQAFIARYYLLGIIYVFLFLTTIMIKNNQTNLREYPKSKKDMSNFPGLKIKEEFRRSWFQAMDEIVKKTRDPKARVILDFLNKNYLLALPVGKSGDRINYKMFRDGELVTPENYPANAVLLVPYQKGDLLPTFSDFDEKVGFYMADYKGIFICIDSPRISSALTTAFTLLHEGNHAYEHFRNNYRYLNGIGELIASERDTYFFEAFLLHEYLGEPVLKIALEMAEKINFTLTFEGQEVKTIGIEDFSGADSLKFEMAMSKIMWPVKKHNEVLLMLGFVKYSALLYKFEQQYPNLLPQEKTKVQMNIIDILLEPKMDILRKARLEEENSKPR